MKAVLLMKAQRRGDLVPVKKQITRSGKTFMQTVYVSPKDAAKTRGGTAESEKPESRPVGQKYGMHNIEAGDKITFETENGKNTSGVVQSAGKDGVMIGGKAVLWKDIRGFTPKAGTKKHGYNDRYSNKKKEFIEPERFTAAEWRKQFDDENATSESILNNFENPKEIKKVISETEDRLEHLEETITWYRREGKDDKAVYSQDRQDKQIVVMSKFISQYKLRRAKPKKGEKPKLVMLGGRGGSGKSWFEGKVYDPKNTIVFDADKVKEQLPEYEGWNATQVHEESSDLIERMIKIARDNKANVVLDATMKTAKSAIEKMKAFKEAGYEIEVHYMHLPRQEAAKRAISRFMGKSKKGRYVPLDVVLGNTTNEETFDMVKDGADRWSFRDNNIPYGEQPILISEKK
jgi:predicted ABC-type ATPase